MLHLTLLALQLAAPFTGAITADLADAPVAVSTPAAPVAAPVAEPSSDDDADDEAGDDGEGEDESKTAESTGPGIRYTSDLSDAELARRWQKDLAALGSISVGFADEGRLINAARMPPNEDAFVCQRPDLAWGAQETIDSLVTAFRAVHQQFPDSAPARLSHIGGKDGGYLRPHRSHQSGRDADIGFFYKDDSVPGGRGKREKYVDLARNWALIRALVTQSDVQVILVDRGIQKILRAHALASGEDPEWVDRVFRQGKHALIQHAKRHKDHFHVRFFAPRSQELGRRIQPLLAQRPEQNIAVHRVKRGQTLGHIAKIYATSVAAIQKVNHMRKTFLHLDQRLLIPLRKPCTRCPLPPAVEVPARCLPANMLASSSVQTPPPAAQ